MTKHEQIRAGLLREREVRAAAYAAAVAERDALAPIAAAADALPTDRGALRHAEARAGLALREMKFWSDPLPEAVTAAPIPESAAEVIASDLPVPSVAETVETADSVAARIFASDSTAPVRAPAPLGLIEAGAVDAEVDAVARRILES